MYYGFMFSLTTVITKTALVKTWWCNQLQRELNLFTVAAFTEAHARYVNVLTVLLDGHFESHVLLL